MIRASRRRLISVAVVVTGLLAILGGRLYYLQVAAHSTYSSLAADDRYREIVQPAVRGEILDDTGKPIVANQSALVVAVNMATVSQQPDGGKAELARLAGLLHTSVETLRERTRICTAGVRQPCWQGSPYQPIPVAQNVSQQVALTVLQNGSTYPGVTAQIQPVTSYTQPVSTAAAQMIGYLQPITQQEMAKLHVPVTGFAGDDMVGQAGLEAQYDQQLRGTPGVRKVTVNAAGQVTATVANTPPQAGDDLVTSINSKLQVATEQALQSAVLRTEAEGNGQARSGAAVVMTTTGRVVAMASYPTYDPSIWSTGIDEQEYNNLFGQQGTNGGEPILERGTQGEYAPGSTWKVTTAVAALRAGYPLDGTYDCPSSIKVDGHQFNNDFANGGPMSLAEALVLSCDTVFYNFGYDIYKHDNVKYDTVTSANYPVQQMQQVELDWGFGKDTGVDLPAESNGTVPTREWLYYFYKDNAHAGQNWCKYGKAHGSYVQQIEYQDCQSGNIWTPGQAVISAIGQGYVSVTPLQLANAYAALANGGTLYSPRIGEELLSPDGKVVQKIDPPVIGHLPATKGELSYIRNALRGVITQGTAQSAFGGFPLGQVCVAGKTGTAQVFGANSNSVFASFAPCNDPQYVVVMMIPDSGAGADVSAPGVRAIWDALYGLEGQKPAIKGGHLPPPPTINAAGKVVQTTSARISTGQLSTGQLSTGQQPTGHARSAGTTPLADAEPGGRPPLGRRR